MARCAALIAICISAVVLQAASAEAQYFGRNKVHYERLDFRVLQTEHFDIYYYAEEEEATRHAARLAERWYARFSRLLDYNFTRRQPLVLYASHPHFAQTNLTAASPAEGTGGFTERTKSRIAMPFAAGLGETDHVLGHEIAHAFQIAVAKSVKRDAFALPGWFIEGMAEYLSIGTADSHTMMWVRDAALHNRLPSLKQLDNPQYFPYRYGHALWSYLAARYGDAIVGRVLRSKVRGNALARLAEATGLDVDQLTNDWHASITAAPKERHPDATVAVRDKQARIHVGPAISPDGRYLMFLSERDRVSLDLFMTDLDGRTATRKIISTTADPHFDSLQYIHSSGAWDSEGRRFAMSALSGGDAVLVIVDMVSRDRREEIKLPDVSEIYNPSWSPDGTKIVLSALKGGMSDLFVYTLESGTLTQLTADPFADLHPSWSPDGRTIAFATDRFTTKLDTLGFGALRIGLLDVATGDVRALTGANDPGGSPIGPARDEKVKEVSPQWSPDARAIYFVSDRSGVSNVYRIDLQSRDLWQVTNVSGGVSGITATSPSLAVASKAGTLAFSVFEGERYEIRTLRESATSRVAVPLQRADAGGSREPAQAQPPAGDDTLAATVGSPESAPTPALAEMLADPASGLPESSGFETKAYDDRLRLESFSQPFFGVATGNAFGGAIHAGFGATFSDLLRDRQLQTAVVLGTDRDDFAAQVTYINRKGQWNWGASGGFIPSRFYGARRAIARDGDLITREMTHLRYLHEWLGLVGRYNMSRSRRIELRGGLRRTGFTWQTVTRVLDLENKNAVSRTFDESPAGEPIFLGEAQAAFVHDTAVVGPTSPILGQRLRVEVEPAFGGLTFADVRVDARRYFMPVRPLTIAARLEHVGRYGPGAADPRLTPLVYGLSTLVRGYDLRSFAIDECGISATSCSMIDELAGSRLALMNLEARVPVRGLFTGDLDYGRLPLEAIAFADAGFLWTRHEVGVERDRFRSVGVGARANLGGFVFEITAARTFDRSVPGWTAGLLMSPGW